MPGGHKTGDHWFVPKPIGFGARPANWKGWAALATYAAVILALIVGCFAFGEPTLTDTTVFFVGMLAATLALVFLAKAKTDGEWRWRTRREGGRDASGPV